jgi:hypothetical protein
LNVVEIRRKRKSGKPLFLDYIEYTESKEEEKKKFTILNVFFVAFLKEACGKAFKICFLTLRTR